MSVKIRFMRTGRVNRPVYRLAVSDTRFKRDGKCIEIVGHYDPLFPDESKQLTLNEERIKYWISMGAKPSGIAWSFLKKRGFKGKPVEVRDRSGRQKARAKKFKKLAGTKKAAKK